MSEPVLKIDGLETYYGKIHALRGINLTVQKGQIVTLLGANGAGKSTTLRTISGLTRAAAGRISFMGRDITATPPHSIVHMGLIHAPEGRRIFKGMTVQENLDLGGFTTHQDKTAREKRLHYIFELFPILSKRRKQDSALLSGGEQQMLAIGRALMAEPAVLLLDEPSLGLAPLLVRQIFSIVREINAQGTTVVLVEQNAHQALGIASRAYVLETGALAISGLASDLARDPRVRRAYLGDESAE